MQIAGQKEKCKSNVHELAKLNLSEANQWNPDGFCNLFIRTWKPINRRASLLNALVRRLNTRSNVCGHRPVSNIKPELNSIRFSIRCEYARFLNLLSQQTIFTDTSNMTLNEDLESVFILFLLSSSFHLFCVPDNIILHVVPISSSRTSLNTYVTSAV